MSLQKFRIYWLSYGLDTSKASTLGFWICHHREGFVRGYGETVEQAYYDYLRKFFGP